MGILAAIFFESIGAYFFWMLNGFRGEYKSYISGEKEVLKSVKNNAVGIMFYILLYLIYHSFSK